VGQAHLSPYPSPLGRQLWGARVFFAPLKGAYSRVG